MKASEKGKYLVDFDELYKPLNIKESVYDEVLLKKQ